MQSESIYQRKLNIFARRTANSGIEPIETTLTPVFDADFGEAIAYRMELKINSLVSGVYSSKEYLSPSLDEKLAVRYALRSVQKATVAQAELAKSGLPCSVLFVRCPVALIYADGVGELLASFLDKLGSQSGYDLLEAVSKICLEFDGSLTDADGETLERALAEIRALQIKTAVDGLGGEGFALEKLISACPDYAFTSARLNALTEDVQKKSALAPVVNLVMGLGGRVIADGIGNDDQLREYRSRGVFGFIPAKSYVGRFGVSGEAKTLGSVISLSKAEYGGERQ